MKMLDHPNIVNLIEVIDDPDSDNFYMGIFSRFLFPFSVQIIFSVCLRMQPCIFDCKFCLSHFLSILKANGFVKALVL